MYRVRIERAPLVSAAYFHLGLSAKSYWGAPARGKLAEASLALATTHAHFHCPVITPWANTEHAPGLPCDLVIPSFSFSSCQGIPGDGAAQYRQRSLPRPLLNTRAARAPVTFGLGASVQCSYPSKQEACQCRGAKNPDLSSAKSSLPRLRPKYVADVYAW